MIPRDRVVHKKIEVRRPDGTWVDLTRFLVSADLDRGNVDDAGKSSGVDDVAQTAAFSFRGDGANPALSQSRNSLSPLDQGSSWNLTGSTYTALLYPNREIRFYAAYVTPGATPESGDWICGFEGYIDSPEFDGPTVSVLCRDNTRQLQLCYIEQKQTYGDANGVAAEVVIQQLLDENLGEGRDYVGSSGITLYCPNPTGFQVTQYEVSFRTVQEAVQEVASKIGWWIGYRWNGSSFVYTLMEPPRTLNSISPDVMTITHTDDLYVQTININDVDLRNAISVTFRDRDSESVTYGQRVTVSAENADSITALGGGRKGRRAMHIEESDTSIIDNTDAATNLLNMAISDLSDMTATTQIQMPLLFEVDVFAGLVVSNPRISSTVDFYGVISVRHSLNFESERYRTEVIAKGKVVGARNTWLRMETKTAGGSQPEGYEIIGSPADNPFYGVAYFQDTPPVSDTLAIGDIWFEQTVGRLWSWDGESWQPQGAGVTYKASAEPLPLDTLDPTNPNRYNLQPGDWWVDTANSNSLSVYSGTGWEPVGTGGTTGDYNKVFYQEALPTSGMVTGDLLVGPVHKRPWIYADAAWSKLTLEGPELWETIAGTKYTGSLLGTRIKGQINLTGNQTTGVTKLASSSIEYRADGIYQNVSGSWVKASLGSAPSYDYISAEPLWMYYIGNSINSYTTTGQTGIWLFDSVTFTTGANESKIRCVFHAYRAGSPKPTAYMYIKVNATTYGNVQMTENWPTTRENTAVDVVVNVSSSTTYTVEFYVQVTENPNQYAQVLQGIDTSPKVFRQAVINAI